MAWAAAGWHRGVCVVYLQRVQAVRQGRVVGGDEGSGHAVALLETRYGLTQSVKHARLRANETGLTPWRSWRREEGDRRG